MNIDHKKDMQDDTIHELCDAILLLKNKEEAYRFLKDLCTPQEMKALSERWRVCRLLDQRELSYRDINSKIGASLATIGRVARFLNNESYGGYQLVLERMHNKKDSIK
jgi:TrpR-related protein YerC/YecD